MPFWQRAQEADSSDVALASGYQTLAQDPRKSVDEESEPRLPEGRAGMLTSVANLSNTILGTGMLAMPHAVAAAGLGPGMFTILLSGSAAAAGLWLLSQCATKAEHRQSSFAALSQLTYPRAASLFDWAIAIKCFGVSISYLIILGSLLPRITHAFASSDDSVPAFMLDRKFWIACVMVVLAPLSFLKTLHALRFTSYVALVAVADLLFVVVFKFFSRSGLTPPGHVDIFHPSSALVSSLPVYTFAYTCAQNLHATYNELRDNSQARMNRVISSSIGGAAIIYLLIGLLGYATFGNSVGSNILDSYHGSLLISTCRVAISVLVLFSYALQLHPCRASLLKIFAREGTDDDQPGSTMHSSFTVGILITSFVIALLVDKLDLVLGFVGATGSTTISFILPALFYLRLWSDDNSPASRRNKRIASVLLAYGLTVMLVCLSLNMAEAISPHHGVGRGPNRPGNSTTSGV